MTSREKILSRIQKKAGVYRKPPDYEIDRSAEGNPIAKFIHVLKGIGGHCIQVREEQEIQSHLKKNFPNAVNTFSHLVSPDASNLSDQIKHHFDVVILKAVFGVAENAAIWLTEKEMIDRTLPFICENLVIILPASEIVGTMHDAYQKIGNSTYQFASFIAGPSKTADIEQSLVLGAHGPKSMTVFLLNRKPVEATLF
jgi:L-lactate dehydrogenase complex protein LldG